MRLTVDYAWQRLRQNKKSSVSILIAIFIASLLLYSLTSVVYVAWNREVAYHQQQSGNWHGGFRQALTPDQLAYLETNPEVEAVLLQSQWRELQLSNTKRPYLEFSQYNAEAWQSMPTKNLLAEGRLPQQPGEVVVSQLFLQDNPQYKLGDALTLPSGQRVLEGEKLEYAAMWTPGEELQADSKETVTIVGTIKMNAVSAYPCYHAYGWLGEEKTAQTQAYTVFARLYQPRQSYQLLPQIAQSLGLSADEEGAYPLRYQKSLLGVYGAKDPEDASANSLSGYLVEGLLTAVLVMALFIVIIYSAFAVTANQQVKQLGVLKSVGATPRQIRRIVLAEAVLPAIPAIPLGIGAGHGLAWLLMEQVNQSMACNALGMPAQQAVFSWPLALGAMLAALVVVVLSAWRPARRLAKLAPIAAVRGLNNQGGAKVCKEQPLAGRLFGFPGELAANALRANQKAYRTTMITLTLCLAAVCSFLAFSQSMNLEWEAQLAADPYNLDIDLNLVAEPPAALLQELQSLSDVQRQVEFRSTSVSILAAVDSLHPTLQQQLASGWQITKESNASAEGKDYRIFARLIGLEQQSFAQYCQQVGSDPKSFLNTSAHPAIVVNAGQGNREELQAAVPADLQILNLAPG